MMKIQNRGIKLFRIPRFNLSEILGNGSKSNVEVFDLTKRTLNISKNKLSKFSFPSDDSNRISQIKNIIHNHIKLNGPIGIDEYMKMCLYDKNFGYYTTKEHIFGEKGDFITSPEISQMFGETIAVFLYKILESTFNFPKSWDLVEIGAGRGFLIADIVHSFIDLKRLKGMNIVIIETSAKLSKIQQENINNILLKRNIFTEYIYDNDFKIDTFVDKNNQFTIKWFDSIDKYISYRNGIILEDASKNPMRNWKKFTQVQENQSLNPLIIINNELFDALPIKQFIYKENSWREVLVDIVKPGDKNKIILNRNDTECEEPNKIEFKYSFSAANSESVNKYLQPDITFGELGIQPKENETYEFSLEQVRYMYSICYLLATTKLSQALICDYGEDQAFSNSFRGIKKQKLYKGDEILTNTGECDLSSYVNFKALKKVINTYHGNLKFGGLMKQGDFLEIMQMYERMKLLQNKTNNFKLKEIIAKQFDRLTLPEFMGDTYKFMYIHKNSHKPCYPFIQEVFDYIAKINSNK